MAISLDFNGAGTGEDASVSYVEQNPVFIMANATIVAGRGDNRVDKITISLPSGFSGTEKLSLSAEGEALASLKGVTAAFADGVLQRIPVRCEPECAVVLGFVEQIHAAGPSVRSRSALTLTGNNNDDSVWQSILRTVVYNDTSDAPKFSARNIEVKAIDKNSGDVQYVAVNVTTVNDAPTGSATATLAGGTEDTAYTISAADLLKGFSDVDGDALSVANLTATNGTLTDNHDGTWAFAPDANYNGTVSLNYSVVDGNGGSMAAVQSFSLAAVNDAPVALGDSFGSGIPKIYEGTEFAINITDLLCNDTDIESDQLKFSAVSKGPANGTLVQTTENGQTYLVYTYSSSTLLENATVADSFVYTVSDGNGGSASATVNLTITGLANAVIMGTNGVDAALTGSDFAHDVIDGQNGDDVVHGLKGNDKLFGNNGVDKLFGDDGFDVLDGGRGDDWLDGGRGNDTLTGGLGADTFVFGFTSNGVSVNTGIDTITDFKLGTDRIQLTEGVSITGMSCAADINGDRLLDTLLNLSNGGSVQVLGVSGVAHYRRFFG